jgi:hypothetical protein
MARRVFRESGLEFSFPTSWGVRKYDEDPHYQSLSSVGLKAVDFIVLPPDGKLWLIEVKNYRPRTRAGKTYRVRLRGTPELAEVINKKFRDSLRAVQVIRNYYRRNWLFRLLEPWLVRHARLRSDWSFWAEANQRLTQTTSAQLLIWLELDASRKRYRTRFYATLQEELADAPVALWMGLKGNNPLAGMEVRRIREAQDEVAPP